MLRRQFPFIATTGGAFFDSRFIPTSFASSPSSCLSSSPLACTSSKRPCSSSSSSSSTFSIADQLECPEEDLCDATIAAPSVKALRESPSSTPWYVVTQSKDKNLVILPIERVVADRYLREFGSFGVKIPIKKDETSRSSTSSSGGGAATEGTVRIWNHPDRCGWTSHSREQVEEMASQQQHGNTLLSGSSSSMAGRDSRREQRERLKTLDISQLDAVRSKIEQKILVDKKDNQSQNNKNKNSGLRTKNNKNSESDSHDDESIKSFLRTLVVEQGESPAPYQVAEGPQKEKLEKSLCRQDPWRVIYKGSTFARPPPPAASDDAATTDASGSSSSSTNESENSSSSSGATSSDQQHQHQHQQQFPKLVSITDEARKVVFDVLFSDTPVGPPKVSALKIRKQLEREDAEWEAKQAQVEADAKAVGEHEAVTKTFSDTRPSVSSPLIKRFAEAVLDARLQYYRETLNRVDMAWFVLLHEKVLLPPPDSSSSASSRKKKNKEREKVLQRAMQMIEDAGRYFNFFRRREVVSEYLFWRRQVSILSGNLTREEIEQDLAHRAQIRLYHMPYPLQPQIRDLRRTLKKKRAADGYQSFFRGRRRASKFTGKKTTQLYKYKRTVISGHKTISRIFSKFEEARQNHKMHTNFSYRNNYNDAEQQQEGEPAAGGGEAAGSLAKRILWRKIEVQFPEDNIFSHDRYDTLISPPTKYFSGAHNNNNNNLDGDDLTRELKRQLRDYHNHWRLGRGKLAKLGFTRDKYGERLFTDLDKYCKQIDFWRDRYLSRQKTIHCGFFHALHDAMRTEFYTEKMNGFYELFEQKTPVYYSELSKSSRTDDEDDENDTEDDNEDDDEEKNKSK